MLKLLSFWITANSGKLLEFGIPDHLICLLRNLIAGGEAPVRTGHGTMNWFQIGKGIHKGCILSHCFQFSVCMTRCDPICSMPGFLVHHQHPELAQTHAHQFGDAIHPTISSSVILFSSCLKSFPESGSFPVSLFFTSGGQIIGVSASASVLPMNIPDCFPLGWTGLISEQSKGLSSLLQYHN